MRATVRRAGRRAGPRSNHRRADQRLICVLSARPAGTAWDRDVGQAVWEEFLRPALKASGERNPPAPLDFYLRYIDRGSAARRNGVTLVYPQGSRFSVSRHVLRRRKKADYERLLATQLGSSDPYAGCMPRFGPRTLN